MSVRVPGVPLNNLEVLPIFQVSRIRILGFEMVEASKAATKLVTFRLGEDSLYGL